MSGNVVVVVVILSMGLLVTVLAVGIVRLRAAAAAGDQTDDPELELGWEGELDRPNITVNPLEVREENIRCVTISSSLSVCQSVTKACVDIY